MTTVRYGARAIQVNREIEAKKADIWSEAVTAVYETDPEIIAAILPPPLEPGPEPLVRITITRVEMPGLPIFGAGWIGVQARHEDRLGEYPILMPMTTEQSLVGGREINGEPKKLAEVEVTRDGAHVSAHIARMGSVICEVTGTVSGTRENYELEKTDFWLKLSPSCEEAGVLDQDPLLVYGEKTERTRLHESIDGELILKEAPLDPVADLVVRRMVDLNWTERASTQVGRVIGPVPRAGVEPFIHQRYDDLSVLARLWRGLSHDGKFRHHRRCTPKPPQIHVRAFRPAAPCLFTPMEIRAAGHGSLRADKNPHDGSAGHVTHPGRRISISRCKESKSKAETTQAWTCNIPGKTRRGVFIANACTSRASILTALPSPISSSRNFWTRRNTIRRTTIIFCAIGRTERTPKAGPRDR